MSMNLLLNPTFNEVDLDLLTQQISNALTTLSQHQTLDDDVLDLINEGAGTDLKTDLNRIYESIRANKIIGTHYQNAFIAAPINFEDLAVIKAMHIMQARLWVSAYVLIQLNGYQDVIHRAFDEFRLLVSRGDKYQLELLPAFNLADDILIKELECAKEKANKSTASRIQNYITLIESYVDRVPDNKKRKRKAELVITHKTMKVKVPSNLPNEVDEPSVERFIEIECCTEENKPNSEEHMFDTPVSSQYVSVTTLTNTEESCSLSIRVQQAKSTANALQKRDKKLITEIGVLTDFEIQKLILNAEHFSKHDSSVYDILLLSLFSGRGVEAIIGHLNNKELAYDGFQYNLTESIRLPSHKLKNIEVDGQIIKKEHLEELLLRAETDVKLTFPSLTTAINIDESLKDTKSIGVKLTKLLTKINKKWHTRITLVKIQNYFSYYLQNKAVDIAEQTLLLGHDIHQSSANYYYQLPKKRLAVIHEHFKKSLLDTSLSREQDEPICDGVVGSQLQLKQDKLGLLLHHINHRLVSTSEYNYDTAESFHNLYTIYVMMILNLSTGYRPVRDPFDNINHFDLINNTVIIDDKNVRGRLAIRMCKLPPLAVKQVEDYLIHLKQLSIFLMPIDNELGIHFQKMINGEEPLFTFIKEHNVARTLQKNIKEELKPILPIPETWYRHLLRTFLRENSVPPEAVDAFMGHSPFGDISFEKFSGLSLSQLSIVADVIQTELFDVLDIKSVKGWGEES